MRCRTSLAENRRALRSCRIRVTTPFRFDALQRGVALFAGLFGLFMHASPAAAQTNGAWTNTNSGQSWNVGANWLGGNVATGTGASADFSTLRLPTGANTVNLNVSETVGSLLFGDVNNFFGWTLATTGGTLTLASGTTPTITVNDQSATISAVIAGSQGFSVSGPGTLILSNASNSYAGTVTISSGNLQAGALTIIPSTSAMSIASGGRFVLSTFNESIGSLTGAGGVANNSTGAVTLTVGGDNTSPAAFSGILTNTFGTAAGTFALTKTGSGIFTLSGTSNNFTGATTISNGNLLDAATNTMAPLSAVSVGATGIFTLGGFSQSVGSLTGVAGGVVTNNSNTSVTLTVGNDNTTPTTFLGAISDTTGVTTGTLSLLKIGTGNQGLGGTVANTYTGGTTVTGGTLTLDFTTLATPTNLISASSVLTVGSATLAIKGNSGVSTATSQTFNGTTLAGGALLTVNGNGGLSTTVALGAITRGTGNTADFTQTAAGSFTTSQINTSNAIVGGWATVAGTNWAVTGSSGTNPVTALSTYQMDNFGTSTFDVTVTAADTPAAFTINSLQYNMAGGLSVALAAVSANTISSGGILVTSTVGAAGASITGTGTLTSGAADLVVNQFDTAGSFTVSAPIVGSIGLTKSGGGILVVSGASTYNGQTTINAGTLTVTTDGSGSLGSFSAPLGASATIAINGGTLLTAAANGNTGMTLNSARGIAIGPSVGVGSGTLAVTNSQQLIYGGPITTNSPLDTFAFGASGFSGAIFVSGASTYSGPTLISFGNFQAAAANVFSPNSAYTVNNGSNPAVVFYGGFKPEHRLAVGQRQHCGQQQRERDAHGRQQQPQPGRLFRRDSERLQRELRRHRVIDEDRHRHLDSLRRQLLYRRDDDQQRGDHGGRRQRVQQHDFCVNRRQRQS